MDANEKRNQSAAPPDNWMQIFLEWKADERGVKETMAAGCLVNKSLACGFTCINVWNLHGISFNSSAHGPTTHHLHAYKADVARSCKEINTVGYGKMTHSPGGPSNKKLALISVRNVTVLSTHTEPLPWIMQQLTVYSDSTCSQLCPTLPSRGACHLRGVWCVCGGGPGIYLKANGLWGV